MLKPTMSPGSQRSDRNLKGGLGSELPTVRRRQLWISRTALLESTHAAVMKLHTFELRDPAGLMNDVAERVPLAEDRAYAALVHHPSTRQLLLEVVPLPLPALLDDDDDISDQLRTVAESSSIRTGAAPKTCISR